VGLGLGACRGEDRGGNFIDTANGYTKGHSEAILGEHLGHDRSKRDRVVLATKFLSNMFLGDPNGGGANRKAVIAQCEESLRRLRTDYIDLYWMHAWDKTTPIEETMRALDTLVEQGKVRYLGFSDTPAWKVAEAQTTARLSGWAPLVALQIEYSLLQRTVEGELVFAVSTASAYRPVVSSIRASVSSASARSLPPDPSRPAPSHRARITTLTRPIAVAASPRPASPRRAASEG
jgi:aryl-alcohol dehydrogenase-like predicted oxidoreductase